MEEYEALLEALTHPSVAPENADHPELKQVSQREGDSSFLYWGGDPVGRGDFVVVTT